MGFVAYFRVSTKQQGESGLGLESQRAILCHYLDCDDLVAEFTEVASAKNIDGRPQLQDAIALCAAGGHTLAVAKLDRLSRRTEDALKIWGQLDGRLWTADIPQENGAMPKFQLTLFMAIADRERELISIRTKAALEAAKARGQKLGNGGEYLTDDGRRAGAAANRQQAQQVYMSTADHARMMRDGGMTYQAIADRLNELGNTTRTGAAFHRTTVKRILDRATA